MLRSVLGVITEMVRSRSHTSWMDQLPSTASEQDVRVLHPVIFGNEAVLLPRIHGSSLPECSLIRLSDWERVGMPRFWIPTVSPESRSIGLAGSMALRMIALSCPSEEDTGATEVMCPRGLVVTEVPSRLPTARWMTLGWGGTFEIHRLRRSRRICTLQLSWKTWYRLSLHLSTILVQRLWERISPRKLLQNSSSTHQV